MARALGLSPRGNALPRFINSKAMADFVSAEMREKMESPLKFKWGTGGAGMPPTNLNGFQADLLIDFCQAVIAAAAGKKLNATRYADVIKQASIVIGASAKAGITGLVYALAGYSPSTE